MKCSFDIYNFLEEISSLSPSVCFYFFASFIEEGLPVSLLFSGTLYSVGLQSFLFLFSLAFHIFSFLTVCKASSVNHFAFLHFFFFGMILVTAFCAMLWTSIHSSLGILSTISNLLNLLFKTGIPDHLTCLLRNLYAGQEGAARTEHLYSGHLCCIIFKDVIYIIPEWPSSFPYFFTLSLNFEIRSS